jgi:hypothetical protein
LKRVLIFLHIHYDLKVSEGLSGVSTGWSAWLRTETANKNIKVNRYQLFNLFEEDLSSSHVSDGRCLLEIRNFRKMRIRRASALLCPRAQPPWHFGYPGPLREWLDRALVLGGSKAAVYVA